MHSKIFLEPLWCSACGSPTQPQFCDFVIFVSEANLGFFNHLVYRFLIWFLEPGDRAEYNNPQFEEMNKAMEQLNAGSTTSIHKAQPQFGDLSDFNTDPFGDNFSGGHGHGNHDSTYTLGDLDSQMKQLQAMENGRFHSTTFIPLHLTCRAWAKRGEALWLHLPIQPVVRKNCPRLLSSFYFQGLF